MHTSTGYSSIHSSIHTFSNTIIKRHMHQHIQRIQHMKYTHHIQQIQNMNTYTVFFEVKQIGFTHKIGACISRSLLFLFFLVFLFFRWRFFYLGLFWHIVHCKNRIHIWNRRMYKPLSPISFFPWFPFFSLAFFPCFSFRSLLANYWFAIFFWIQLILDQLLPVRLLPVSSYSFKMNCCVVMRDAICYCVLQCVSSRSHSFRILLESIGETQRGRCMLYDEKYCNMQRTATHCNTL